ncbi:MAG: PEP-CTERM sorting domain-containing protein [Phycisphaerales bacterium]|nr:MAG: PEP-CTERM sorting domain-containing protein [Phycisphaerales bacterium]
MRLSSFGYLIGMLAVVPFARADIIDWDAADDGDGAIVCTTAFDDVGYVLDVDGVQYWWPGHVEGYFTTDTEQDPTVWFRNTVTNDMTVPPYVWTDFHITMQMNKTFNILDAFTSNTGWSYSYTPTATWDGDLGLWVGSVDFVMDPGGEPIDGTLIADGQFDFQVSWVGSMTFCMEYIPTPEPAALALLGLGGLFLRRLRR